MGEYKVIGGNKLYGEVTVEGAKNAVLPILASTILNKGQNVIHNVPMLLDTKIALQILEYLGCTYKIEGNTVTIDSSGVNNFDMPIELVKKMRSSIIFMGALISVFKECNISSPGGCKLGKRPIDLHLKNLKQLNININDEGDTIICNTNEIIGNTIELSFPSVGATENLILASVFAKGETVIKNPAQEPEIIDLQNFLNRAGANIKGAGTNEIVIKGVKRLLDVEYTVMPDRIVAGTYLVGAIMTKGDILLSNVNCSDMQPIIDVLKQTGVRIKKYDKENKISLSSYGIINAIEKIETNPHPKTPTDMQSQFCAMLSIANGKSIVIENLFEDRNKHVAELNKMGANITDLDNRTFIIDGVDELTGQIVEAKDLRGGASLILAGLVAKGETVIKNSEHIERGYVEIQKKLRNLGANIKYI